MTVRMLDPFDQSAIDHINDAFGVGDVTRPVFSRSDTFFIEDETKIQPDRVYPKPWFQEPWLGDLARAADGDYPDILASLQMADPPSLAQTRDEALQTLDLNLSPEAATRRAEIAAEADAFPETWRNLLFLEQNRRILTTGLMHLSATWSLPIIMYFKDKYARPRPQQIEPRLEPPIPCPTHPSYPSGHATQGYLFANIVVRLTEGYESDFGAAFYSKATRFAENREYAGLHYRSDTLAGLDLAQQIAPIFLDVHATQIQRVIDAEW